MYRRDEETEFSLAGTRKIEEEEESKRKRSSKEVKVTRNYGILMQDQANNEYNSSGNLSSERQHRSLKPKPIV